MAVTFTDEQLRTASKDLLDTTQQVELLDLQAAQTDEGKQDAYNKDQNNKIFFDNYMNIVNKYNTERRAIDGNTITEYSENTLVQSAKQASGNLHFPMSPVWVNFPPKLLSENNGNPTSVNPVNEMLSVATASVDIDELKNGFADGAISSTLYSAYVPNAPIQYNGVSAFSVGDRIVIYNGTNSLVGKVLTSGAGSGGFCTPAGPTTEAACLLALGTWTPSPYDQEITIEVLQAPLGSLGAGATIRNYYSGYTNSQREYTVAVPNPEILTYYEGKVNTSLGEWITFLNTQLTALSANDASGPESTEISTAETNVQSAISVYNTFVASPGSGSGVGRYGDTIINQVSAKLTSRLSEGPARSSQILSRFGSVSQNSAGDVSGTGQFYNVWKWIELRTTKSGGSLLKYYSFELTKTFVSSVQRNSTNKSEEYSSAMSVFKLAADTNGTNIISVLDSTGLSISDDITILDDIVSHGIYNVTITNIDGNTITVDQLVSKILASDIGRVVKRL